MKLNQYIDRQLWQRVLPREGPVLWVGTQVLTLPIYQVKQHLRSKQIKELVYGAYQSIEFFSDETEENSYLNNWNGSRQDVVAEYMVPPKADAKLVDCPVDSRPDGDLSLWLCERLLGFTRIELTRMTPSYISLQEPIRGLVPVLKGAHESLKRMRLQDPLLQAWNRQRYLLVRYYLDAVYHELPC